MTTEQQEPTPKTNAPRFEIALILIFFICFIMWSVSRCSDKREEMRAEEIIENSEDLQSEESATTSATSDVATETTTTATTAAAPATPVTNPAPAATTPTTTPPKPTPQTSDAGALLYVTIDNLNMRTHPHLDSAIVSKLPLFERVTFLNEVTDFKQEINLGKEMANEPWVKVQTKRGKAGWVYGAGVHYHKVAREGVQ